MSAKRHKYWVLGQNANHTWGLLAIVESEKLRQTPIKRASPNLLSSTLSRLKVEKSPAAFERCDLALAFSMACKDFQNSQDSTVLPWSRTFRWRSQKAQQKIHWFTCCHRFPTVLPTAVLWAHQQRTVVWKVVSNTQISLAGTRIGIRQSWEPKSFQALKATTKPGMKWLNGRSLAKLPFR